MVLADSLNTSPEFWLNLQMSVDLWRAQQKHKTVKKLAGIA
jgi:plasmid maintenance system antidote protein VapI